MEAITAITDIDLKTQLAAIAANNQYSSDFLLDDELQIRSADRGVVKVNEISAEELYDSFFLNLNKDNIYKVYALYYNNIVLLKKLIASINCKNVWINNDFDDVYYNYFDFLEIMERKPDWDWRIRGVVD